MSVLKSVAAVALAVGAFIGGSALAPQPTEEPINVACVACWPPN